MHDRTLFLSNHCYVKAIPVINVSFTDNITHYSGSTNVIIRIPVVSLRRTLTPMQYNTPHQHNTQKQ